MPVSLVWREPLLIVLATSMCQLLIGCPLVYDLSEAIQAIRQQLFQSGIPVKPQRPLTSRYQFWPPNLMVVASLHQEPHNHIDHV